MKGDHFTDSEEGNEIFSREVPGGLGAHSACRVGTECITNPGRDRPRGVRHPADPRGARQKNYN
jgi:hypothetical protein